MKKRIILAIFVGIIVFCVGISISLALDYHNLKKKNDSLQYKVDTMFLNLISEVEIKDASTLEDEVIFTNYYEVYKQLQFAGKVYKLTSYEYNVINSPDEQSEIGVDVVLMKTRGYIFNKAQKKERMDGETIKFICESLKNIAENMENREERDMYVNELYEKMD